MVVKAIPDFALSGGDFVGCHSGSCRAPDSRFPAHRTVRIVVSLRGHVRCMVWRLWPGIVRNRSLGFGLPLLLGVPN